MVEELVAEEVIIRVPCDHYQYGMEDLIPDKEANGLLDKLERKC